MIVTTFFFYFKILYPLITSSEDLPNLPWMDQLLNLLPACARTTFNSTPEAEVLGKKKLNSVAVVRKRTIPTERPPLVGEVSVNLCG
jgi:hypothetical protein